VGEAKEFGGDVMIRAGVLQEMGGYNPAIIAAEDTELAVRLRVAGWRLQRLDAEMTLHDAAITRFGQWWKRNVRAGHGFAEVAEMHGKGPTRHWLRQSRSIWLWGWSVPLGAAGCAWPTGGLSLLLLGVYPLLYWKIRRNARRRGLGPADAAAVAKYTLLGKFPQMIGQWTYWRNRLRGRRSRIIEYKGAGPAAVRAG
jgi:hypothetical protein